MKKKTFIKITNITATALLSLATVGCILLLLIFGPASGLQEQNLLKAPVLSVNGDIVSWQDIEDAGSYTILLNNEVVEEDYQLNSYKIPQGGDDSINVIIKAISAVQDKGDSTSETLFLTRLPVSSAVFVDKEGGEDYLFWHKLSGASRYIITVGEDTHVFTDSDELKFKLDETAETINFAVESNTNYIISNEITLNLNPAKLDVPENLTTLGTRVMWDAVDRAISYNVYINGTFKKTVSRNYYVYTEATEGLEITVKANGIRSSNLSDTSDPANLVVNEVSLYAAALAKAQEYKAVEINGTGRSMAAGITLSSRVTSITNFGRDAYALSVSKGPSGLAGGIATRAFETYYSLDADMRYSRNTGGANVVDANLMPNFSGVSILKKTTAELALNSFDYMRYIVSADSVKQILQPLEYNSATKTFSFKLSLKSPEGTHLNRLNVVEVGDLDDCTYNSCELTFTIDENMNLISYSLKDDYMAYTTMNAQTISMSDCTFSYYTEYRNIEELKGVSAWAR